MLDIEQYCATMFDPGSELKRMVYSEEEERAVAQNHIIVRVSDVSSKKGPLLMLLAKFHSLHLRELHLSLDTPSFQTQYLALRRQLQLYRLLLFGHR